MGQSQAQGFQGRDALSALALAEIVNGFAPLATGEFQGLHQGFGETDVFLRNPSFRFGDVAQEKEQAPAAPTRQSGSDQQFVGLVAAGGQLSKQLTELRFHACGQVIVSGLRGHGSAPAFLKHPIQLA